MNKTIDFFIDSKNDLASFEYYFEEYLNIKSVTLKSIMFYNSWWTGDSFANAILYTAITDIKKILLLPNYQDLLKKKVSPNLNLEPRIDRVITNERNIEDFLIPQRHFSLAEFCSKWEDNIKKSVDHVKIYCDQNNYIIIELLEDKEFSLEMIFNTERIEKEDIRVPPRSEDGTVIGEFTKEIFTKSN